MILKAGLAAEREMIPLIRVLFVCLGNICRSPMAEAIFRRKVKDAGLHETIEADSAGTGNWHTGEPPHHGTRQILRRYNVSYAGIAARQIGYDDLRTFQYIVVMDAKNRQDVARLAEECGSEAAHVHMLLEFVPDSAVKDVPDPYFTGNFDEVYELIDRGCSELLQIILDEHPSLA